MTRSHDGFAILLAWARRMKRGAVVFTSPVPRVPGRVDFADVGGEHAAVTRDRHPPRAALAHTNRFGMTFYLHAGKTKTGKTRYFVAKSVGAGALATTPAGFEFIESINGVVSVRRVAPTVVPPKDLALVQEQLALLGHLRYHRAEVVHGEIVIFEPGGGLEVAAVLGDAFGLGRTAVEQLLNARAARTRYAPVMKFVPGSSGAYTAYRMTYRGKGGWSWPLGEGRLEKVVSKYLRHVGTEEFFELL